MMTEINSFKILIVDDHPVFRKGIASIISNSPNFIIVGEASNGVEALQLINKFKPDLITLDIDMPEMDGIELIRKIKQKNISIQIVVITMYKQANIFNEIMDLGAAAYLLKECAADEIIDCLESLRLGNTFVSGDITKLLQSRIERLEVKMAFSDVLKKLTTAELNIIRLVAEQKTSRKIADMLFVSHKTIENHRANICKKLNLQGTNALLKWAIENKEMILV